MLDAGRCFTCVDDRGDMPHRSDVVFKADMTRHPLPLHNRGCLLSLRHPCHAGPHGGLDNNQAGISSGGLWITMSGVATCAMLALGPHLPWAYQIVGQPFAR